MSDSENIIPSHILNPGHVKHLEAITSFDPSLITVDFLRQATSMPAGELPAVDVSVKQLEIPGEEGVINVDLYRPNCVKPSATIPVLIYIPGGGWCLPPQNMHSFTVSKLATESKCAVMFVNYSLSPEVKFPVALNQCFSVLTWILNTENASRISVDASRLAVAGDSAGGNLAAALMVLAKQHCIQNAVKYQLLFYPVLDATWNTESYREYGDKGYFSSLPIVKLFWEHYRSSEKDEENPLACPSKFKDEDLKGLPPAFIVTSHVDVLRDEAEEYARKLMIAGVPVSSMRVMHAMHGFLSVYSLLCEETFSVIDSSAGILRRLFGQ
ncbi:Alpha/Beta hydrolase protein [Sporodiniella umbellata]|nr:Alpha/Beta hydrolase protein [Sporodiniella umbellata]